LTGFFSLLLWFGCFLCFIGYGIQEDGGLDKSNLYLGIVLGFVTIATGIFSYMQASKSAEMMAQFENFIPPTATVIRDERETNIDAKYIIPGDIVIEICHHVKKPKMVDMNLKRKNYIKELL